MASISNYKDFSSSYFSKNKLSLKIRTETIFLICGIFLFRYICDESYLITKMVFNYENPFLFEPSFFSKIVSWIFLISFLPFLSKIYFKKNPSDNIIFLLGLVSLVPSTTLIAANGSYSIIYIFLLWIYWFLLFALCILIPSFNLNALKKIRSKHFYMTLIFLICASVVYLSWLNTGFRIVFNIFDSAMIYGLRVEAREYSSFPFIGYLQHAGDNLLPILMVYVFAKGKKLLSLFLLFVILLNFGITASKQVFLLLFLGVISCFFIKKVYLPRLFLIGAILVTLATILEFYILKTAISSMFSSYRIYFIPAKYHYIYYEFFSTYQPDYFRQSFLRYFFESPYDRSLHMILADYHNRDYYARANNGLFSDAVMNLGYLGTIIFPILVILVLKLLDGATQNLPLSVIFIVIVTTSFMLLNLNLSIALISGGLLLILFTLYSLPRQEQKS